MAQIPYGGHDPSVELKLALPQGSAEESRSYRFFLYVAAPELAGVFNVDFWLGEIPQACHADPAIWHAVISLGAIHEAYILNRRADSECSQSFTRHKVLALQQYNLAIRCLYEPSPRISDKWRALTASVIFTCICSLQGLYDQARVHHEAGSRLL